MVLTADIASLFDTNIALGVTFSGFMLVVCASILAGVVIGAVYIHNRRNEILTSDLTIAMVTVPTAAAVVIMLVGRNIAAGLGLSGIFVLVRFRSGPVAIKDLAYLFSAICSGILAGSGYVAYAIMFALILSGVITILETAGWGNYTENPMLLKIWIPESLNFQGVFDPILTEYTESYRLLMIRTTDFGSNCELRYRIVPKKEMDQKKFLDEIRIRNGNMNVVLIVAPQIIDNNGRQVF